MGMRKMHIRTMMDERPRLTYDDLAKAINRSRPLVASWMADEPTEEQEQRLVEAVRIAREGQKGVE